MSTRLWTARTMPSHPTEPTRARTRYLSVRALVMDELSRSVHLDLIDTGAQPGQDDAHAVGLQQRGRAHGL